MEVGHFLTQSTDLSERKLPDSMQQLHLNKDLPQLFGSTSFASFNSYRCNTATKTSIRLLAIFITNNPLFLPKQDILTRDFSLGNSDAMDILRLGLGPGLGLGRVLGLELRCQDVPGLKNTGVNFLASESCGPYFCSVL